MQALFSDYKLLKVIYECIDHSKIGSHSVDYEKIDISQVAKMLDSSINVVVTRLKEFEKKEGYSKSDVPFFQQKRELNPEVIKSHGEMAEYKFNSAGGTNIKTSYLIYYPGLTAKLAEMDEAEKQRTEPLKMAKTANKIAIFALIFSSLSLLGSFLNYFFQFSAGN